MLYSNLNKTGTKPVSRLWHVVLEKTSWEICLKLKSMCAKSQKNVINYEKVWKIWESMLKSKRFRKCKSEEKLWKETKLKE